MEQWLGAVWQRIGGIRVLHRGRFTNVEDNPPLHAEILSGVFTRFSWLWLLHCRVIMLNCRERRNQLSFYHLFCRTTLCIRMKSIETDEQADESLFRLFRIPQAILTFTAPPATASTFGPRAVASDGLTGSG